MKKSITRSLLLFLVLCAFTGQAQDMIQTRLGYHYLDKFEFTDEWQYLTTDMYLLNAGQFSKVINELEQGTTKARRRDYINLESLFISAQLKNAKLFGQEPVVYPLYNFAFEPATDKKNYASRISDNIDAIRIIDKLPLASDERNIDATVQARLFTSDSREVFFNIIANQLTNIAKQMSPQAAMLSLVGEFGNLIRNSAQRKEYKFSSTIRLYEGQNFDTRLHSVRVYVFVPSFAKLPALRTPRLTELLSNSPQGIERQKLEAALNYKDYPVLVVANYKSLYKMDALSGSDITSETIERRRVRIEQAFTAGLVTEDAYKQEKLFVEFLRNFSDLKQNLNNFRLNYKNNSPEANAKTLFAVLQDYKRLRTLANQRDREFSRNHSYQRIFKAEYNTILASADSYLDSDFNLKNGKDMVNTLLDLEQETTRSYTVAQREQFLNKLYAVELPNPEFLASTLEGEGISRHLNRLESAQYNDLYAKEVIRLRELAPTEENITFRNTLLEKANATKCRSCREEVKQAARQFNQRLEEQQLEKEKSRLQELNGQVERKIIAYLKQDDCMENAFKTQYPTESLPDYVQRLYEKKLELRKHVAEFDQLYKSPPKEMKLDNLREHNHRLSGFIRRLDQGYADICAAEKNLCGCS
ncbi:hypothetical protein ACD591_01445 [Rufibacter glacialis]|uniref:Uncharacterized protein n=1 Tax=Rufibacter glacialis TaxID=1259555 RepID=A0A5M8QJX2_9BACT|nr:hypothetical protein [Rufibacter glacialis]KAA6435558.1 hypothetical protein FOE74_06345 [Rufibacter glacialis]GGK64587.1 hypothetical protein GCM10011405_10690 [Rufibacter glacialis]